MTVSIESTSGGGVVNFPSGNTLQVNGTVNATTVTGNNLNAVAYTGDYNSLSNRPNLAAVATTGNYNDLSNRPSIPGGFSVGAPYWAGAIASGTCWKNTFVRCWVDGGNITSITINGVGMGNDRTYHDNQGHGTFFFVPAGQSWSVARSSGTWYMEVN